MGRSEDLRVVAFGGGTGLPVLLRGLRDRVGDLVAVVTVADDGGSSGRIRQELGVAPPGDVRNCLVALAGRKGLAEVFNYRFEGGGGDLSNLVLTDGTVCGPTGTATSASGKDLDRHKNRFLPPQPADLDPSVNLAALLRPGDDLPTLQQERP